MWYSTTPSADGRVVVSLAARRPRRHRRRLQGALATRRRQLQRVRRPRRRGDELHRRQGTGYLIAVSERSASVSDVRAERHGAIVPAHPPGKPLPALGVTRTLDRIANPDDAWAVHCTSASPNRIHLSGRTATATSAQLYAPRTASFDGGTVATQMPCGGTTVHARPRSVGAVHAARADLRRAPQAAYHVEVAPAGATTRRPASCCTTATASGGRSRLTGRHGRPYRFVITHRSVAFLRLSGATSTRAARRSRPHHQPPRSNDPHGDAAGSLLRRGARQLQPVGPLRASLTTRLITHTHRR